MNWPLGALSLFVLISPWIIEIILYSLKCGVNVEFVLLLGSCLDGLIIAIDDIKSQSFSSVFMPDWAAYLSGNLFCSPVYETIDLLQFSRHATVFSPVIDLYILNGNRSYLDPVSTWKRISFLGLSLIDIQIGKGFVCTTRLFSDSTNFVLISSVIYVHAIQSLASAERFVVIHVTTSVELLAKCQTVFLCVRSTTQWLMFVVCGTRWHWRSVAFRATLL